jgi:hypothetical protein
LGAAKLEKEGRRVTANFPLSEQIRASRKGLQDALISGGIDADDVPAVHNFLRTMAWIEKNEMAIKKAHEMLNDPGLKAALAVFPEAEIVGGDEE